MNAALGFAGRGAAVVLLLGAALPANASTLARHANETAESFARRNGPLRAALAHKVVETRAWGGTSKAIIAFYEEEEPARSRDGDRRIEGSICVPEGRGTYRKIAIDVFEPEGGDPEIEAVFFADAGGDKEKKLVVLCSWPQVHYDYRGRLYGVFVYEAPRPGTRLTKLKFEDAISKKLESGCDCQWRDGRKTTARYKTAAAVKTALRKMGP
ncbi:MAG: hypothetical protein ACM3PC_12765 [Deltaproteobacteria bacterium]